ncbi:alpha/beta hydrolase fold domain-containing protein [bacterium]|nr:alpha/beta hydrolase fold domain-containing protein [bacterium]
MNTNEPGDTIRKRPSRLRRFAVAVVLLMFALTSSAGVAIVFARNYLRRDYVPGHAPRGYDRREELYAAYFLGVLRLIERQPGIPPEIRYEQGVTYARASGQELKLDLYFPQGHTSQDHRPLLVLIHGGGWKSGQREDYRPYALKVAKAGYVVASLSYRLSGVAKFPAQIRDVNAALQFLGDRSGEYGIDPERFVVMGGSAGGHLAMLAGYARDEAEYRPEADAELKLNLPDSKDGERKPYVIAAVFDFYGPSDLTTPFARSQPVVPELIGEPYEEKQAIYRSASPMFRISSDAPPSLVVHGTLDDIVPVEQSDKLAEGLHWVRVPVRYERLFGWPHTMDLAEPVFGYLSDVVLEELRKHVGEGNSSRH